MTINMCFEKQLIIRKKAKNYVSFGGKKELYLIRMVREKENTETQHFLQAQIY